jgi:hypothetical protein
MVSAALSVLAALAAAGCASQTGGDGTGPAFASPQKAVDSLVSAARSGSPDRIVKVLGPDADDLVRSGDPVQDRNRTRRFVTLYDQQHELIPTALADDWPNVSGDVADTWSESLCIGESRLPFPIPLVKDGTRWRFDTARGKDEILNRRIGRNELSAIQVCRAIVDAERDYVSRRESEPGGLPEYAGKFISDAGKTNGLYWPTSQGQPPSPLADLVAAAADEGYEIAPDQPYRGYYYRILKSQGPHATAGAYDYEVKGKLIGGFAVLARPATYGNSGVMTFMVNHEGVVSQADLGPDTQYVADKIKSFDPDSRWQKVE